MKDPFYKRESEKYDSPIASRELILSYLTELEKPANLDNIAKAMNINNEQQKEALHRRLRAMERDGQLIFTRRKCYALPEKCAMLKGNVIGHRDGFGFLRVDGVADDYFLAPEQMRKTLHGDVVLAQPMSHQYKGKIEARVVRILEHRNPLIVGRYFIEEGIGFVVPDDIRLNFDILITEQQEQTIRMGAVVVVELLKRPEYRKKAIGKITEVLGENMGTNLAIDIALRNHDIPHSFPKIVDQSASKFNETVPESAKKGRKDLTDLPLITIDGEDARDFDDAVYCKKNRGGGYRLWVAIADVSYYVRPKTDLDIEAYNRSTSVYFPSRVVPMLPEVLSNGLCSLNPQVDRLCLVCEMTISLNGRLTGYEFYEAVMNSHARLTYNKVQKILDGDKELREQYKPRIKDIENLHGLYQILDKTRIERGAIAFESAEPKFIFNADKRIERVEIAVRNDAHKIIEECMILANVAAAKFVEKNQLPCLYRVHDKPNKDRLINLKTTINELGLRLQFSDEPTSKDIAKLMEQVAKRPDHEMLQTMILRSMKQAIYDAENRGHFGLALESYAHFTSPIRRYPDLLLHRTIKWILDNQKKQPSKTGGNRYEMNEMLMFGEHCSNNERRADEAVRDVVDWLKCDFMQDHVGESFDGTISTVTNFGFFVRLNDLFIDGLVHVATLENDYYQFDAERNRLIGESGRISYRLGDKVNITVLAVNPEDRKMDFILTGSSQKRSKPKSQRKKSSTSNRMEKNSIESADKELKPSKKKSEKGNQSSKRKGKVKDKSSEESLSKEKTKKKQRTKKPKSQIKVNKELTTALNQRKKSSKK